jgi:TsgA-like MFS transporter
VIAGLLNPIGLISGPVAEAFNISITDAVARFGYFTFGVFGGYILSFYIFDFIKLRSVVFIGYGLLAGAVAALHYSTDATVMVVSLFLIGLLASIQVCAASTLASWTWSGNPRQTVLIAQDAMFNGGGIVFTLLTTWLLAENYRWSTVYMVVAGVALLVALIALSSKVPEAQVDNETASKTDWNFGILAVGGSVLFFMMAKISIFIWAPQYAAQAFGADVAQSGQLLTNIFIGAFIGSLAGTFIVSKTRNEYFLLAMLSIGACGLWLMTAASDLDSMLLIAYMVGASVGATFNGYMAFGLSFVKTPTHKNVAYILLAGGIGSAIAPIFSSEIVAQSGSIQTALVACMSIQIAVLVSVLLLTVLGQQRLREAESARD